MLRKFSAPLVALALALSLPVGCASADGTDATTTDSALTPQEANRQIFQKNLCAKINKTVPGARCEVHAPSYATVGITFDIPDGTPGVRLPRHMEVEAAKLETVSRDLRRMGFDVPEVPNLRPAPTPGGPPSTGTGTLAMGEGGSLRIQSGVIAGAFVEFIVNEGIKQGIDVPAGKIAERRDEVYTIDPSTKTEALQANVVQLQNDIKQLEYLKRSVEIADDGMLAAIAVVSAACPATILATVVLAVSWEVPVQIFLKDLEEQIKGRQKEIDADRSELVARGAGLGTINPGGGPVGGEPSGSHGEGAGSIPTTITQRCVTRKGCVRIDGGAWDCKLITACEVVN